MPLITNYSVYHTCIFAALFHWTVCAACSSNANNINKFFKPQSGSSPHAFSPCQRVCVPPLRAAGLIVLAASCCLSIRRLTERWAAAALSPSMPPSPCRPSGLIALAMEDLSTMIPGHILSSITHPHSPVHLCPTPWTYPVHVIKPILACVRIVCVYVCARMSDVIRDNQGQKVISKFTER